MMNFLKRYRYSILAVIAWVVIFVPLVALYQVHDLRAINARPQDVHQRPEEYVYAERLSATSTQLLERFEGTSYYWHSATKVFYVYPDGQSEELMHANPKTFRVRSEHLAMDGERVYGANSEIKNADRETIEELGKDGFFRDKDSIHCPSCFDNATSTDVVVSGEHVRKFHLIAIAPLEIGGSAEVWADDIFAYIGAGGPMEIAHPGDLKHIKGSLFRSGDAYYFAS